MSAAEPVVIMMSTWCPPGEAGVLRRAVAMRAAQSWFYYLRSPNPLHLHVADDGSPVDTRAGEPIHVTALREMAERYGAGFSTTRVERRGIGASMNAGIRAARALGEPAAFLYAVDDWVLDEPFDLGPSLRLMAQGAVYVRIGMTHPNLGGSVRRQIDEGGELWVLHYDWSLGGYVFSDRPSLRAPALYDAVGPYAEGGTVLQMEADFNQRCSARFAQGALTGGGALAGAFVHAPNATLRGPFTHIESVELAEDLPEALTAKFS